MAKDKEIPAAAAGYGIETLLRETLHDPGTLC